MLRNHVAKHGEEVEPEGAGYQKWRLQINEEDPIEITSNKLLKLLSGSNATVSLNEDGEVVFAAQMKIVPKPNKYIDDPTYTLQDSDYDKWIVFRTDCTVTVPQGLTIHRIFEGESDENVTVTFVGASGTKLRHTASISRTLSADAPFAVRVSKENNYLLFGTDPTNYAG